MQNRYIGRRITQTVPTIPVMVVSRDSSLIAAVKLHLAESFPIEVVAVASSGQQCLTMLEELSLRVVLISYDLTDLPPFQLSRQINLAYPYIATVILSARVDVEYLQEALASGARGVIQITPSQEGWIISGQELTTRIHQVSQFTPPLSLLRPRLQREGGGHVIVVYSAKGGVGKSLLAVNLAAFLAQANPDSKVVLADMNLQLGIDHLLLDIQPTHTITDFVPLIEELIPETFAELLARRELANGQKMFVMPAPDQPAEASYITGSQVGGILAALRRYYDCVVIDTTSTISDVTAAALRIADDILLVCTPDVLSISLTRRAIQYLTEDPDLGINPDSISLVLNRVSDKWEIRPQDIEGLFERPIVGQIPDDPLFVQSCLNRGVLFIEGADGRGSHPFVSSLRQMAAALSREVPGVSASPGTERASRRGLSLRRLRS